jgi:hypothetical protein
MIIANSLTQPHLAVLVVELLHDHLLQPDEELLEADAAAAVKVQLSKQLVAQRLGRPVCEDQQQAAAL